MKKNLPVEGLLLQLPLIPGVKITAPEIACLEAEAGAVRLEPEEGV